jgi:2-polyprenyl-3-methyl-5-hydroxy-6-metoxy-1,4-benzoquinol methylase
MNWFEIQRFLDTSNLSQYQKIALPYGLKVRGQDHSNKIEAVYKENLAGKSILDVGCYYRLYCHEAIRRGAKKAVGVEPNKDRARVAQPIAHFLENDVEVLHGDIMSIELDSKFDIIFFLSVLHHVPDPIAVMRRLASLCADTVIVEFCLHTHELKRHKQIALEKGESWIANFRHRAKIYYQKQLLTRLDKEVGLILTGDLLNGANKKYHYTYFYNQQAFRAVFEVQTRIFSSIEFVPSTQKPNRMLAFCKVNQSPH